MKKLLNMLNDKELIAQHESFLVKGGNNNSSEDDKRRERPGGIQTQRLPEAAMSAMSVKTNINVR